MLAGTRALEGRLGKALRLGYVFFAVRQQLCSPAAPGAVYIGAPVLADRLAFEGG